MDICLSSLSNQRGIQTKPTTNPDLVLYLVELSDGYAVYIRNESEIDEDDIPFYPADNDYHLVCQAGKNLTDALNFFWTIPNEVDWRDQILRWKIVTVDGIVSMETRWTDQFTILTKKNDEGALIYCKEFRLESDAIKDLQRDNISCPLMQTYLNF